MVNSEKLRQGISSRVSFPASFRGGRFRQESLYIGNLRIVPLLDVEEADLETFAQQVQTHGGKIPVMVHPYYQREGWFGLNPPFKPPPEFVVQRNRFIKACLGGNVPLIIFEEAVVVHELPGRLGDLLGKVYVVGTGLRTPDPVCPAGWEKGWEEVGRTLHEAGVNHIVVGGLLRGGCVDVAAKRFLQQGFEVSLSAISAPEPTAGPIPTQLI